MTKVEMPLSVASAEAEILRIALSQTDLFTRVEVAGSVRRRKPVVGDLELVAQGAEGADFMREDRTRELLERCGVTRAPPDAAGKRSPWGPRYYRGVKDVAGYESPQVQIDLFVVLPPAVWPVVFLIRTGSARFSQAIVTRLHRYGLQSAEGHIERKCSPNETVPCETEEDFFRLAGMPYVPPENRTIEDPVAERAFRTEFLQKG